MLFSAFHAALLWLNDVLWFSCTKKITSCPSYFCLNSKCAIFRCLCLFIQNKCFTSYTSLYKPIAEDFILLWNVDSFTPSFPSILDIKRPVFWSRTSEELEYSRLGKATTKKQKQQHAKEYNQNLNIQEDLEKQQRKQ